jgi:hypothetical protein
MYTQAASTIADLGRRLKVAEAGLYSLGAPWLGQIVAVEPGSSPPVAEVWHDLSGALQNSWTVSATRVARYRLTPQNEIQFDLWLNSGTATDATVVATLTGSYVPAADKLFPVSCDVPAVNKGPRFVLYATGNLECYGIGSGAVGAQVKLPLD